MKGKGGKTKSKTLTETVAQPVSEQAIPATAASPPQSKPEATTPPPVAPQAQKSPQTPELSALDIQNKRLYFMGKIALVVIIAATGFVLWMYFKNPPQKQTVTTPVIVEMEPSQKEKTSFDRSEWTLEVLNGSGVAGTAGKMAKKLEALGYTISKIGNAARQNYTSSEIFISPEFSDQSEQIIADLENILESATVSGELTEGTASARLVIGRRDAQ